MKIRQIMKGKPIRLSNHIAKIFSVFQKTLVLAVKLLHVGDGESRRDMCQLRKRWQVMNLFALGFFRSGSSCAAVVQLTPPPNTGLGGPTTFERESSAAKSRRPGINAINESQKHKNTGPSQTVLAA